MHVGLALLTFLLVTAGISARASAQTSYEHLCDNSYQDCRSEIITLIRNETVGIDVSFWFMTDTNYSTEIIKRWKAGVPVRVILDTRADANCSSNATVRQSLINAGIPIRTKFTAGINHWKVMIYAGQGKMQFSAANFANGSYNYTNNQPYVNYVDEAVYFTDDPDILQSFERKYDDIWMDSANYQNVANINTPLVRSYPGLASYPIDPDLNFPPDADYQDRVVSGLKQEALLPGAQVDAVMFRITSSKIPDQLIKMKQAGIPVRLVTDQNQYRTTTYFWDSYNVDRMYMAGIPVKWKNLATGQDMHQKSIIMYAKNLVAFGSSNWTASSSDAQREHNYFAKKLWFFQWFIDQFNRKWNNVTVDGQPVSPAQFQDFVPGYPETPVYVSPTDGQLGLGASVTLKWEGGWWAHKYDIYFGTTSTPPLLVQDFAMPNSSTAGVVSAKESYTVTGLQPGVTYYWRIVSKTMANGTRPDGTQVSRTKTGAVVSFTTTGGGTIPPAPTGLTATAPTGTTVNLSWNDPGGEDGFKVERKLASSSTWAQIGTTGAGVVTYTDSNSGLTAGTSYTYRVRAYTTAGNSGYSNTAPITTPFAQISAGDVVLYAEEAPVLVGNWAPVADASAAGGARLYNLNSNGGTVTTPLANPVHYFEMNFGAQAGRPYHLWIRGKALNNSGYNDSVWVQFNDSVTSGGSPQFGIGTTSGTWVNLQDYSGATINGWGWQDNGFGQGVMGPDIYFANDGTHTIRVQVREDGFSIDQIVLSPDTFYTTAPGSNTLDETKLPKQTGIIGDQLPANEARVLADTYVRAGTSASTSFGALSEVIVKYSVTADYLREGYMTLDVSAVQPGDTVTLRLFGHLSDTRAAVVTTNVFSVANTSWPETGLNYNNRPASGTTAIGSVNVAGTTGQWYDIDLTSYAQAQRTAGATAISIALKGNADTLPYVTFSSRESGVHPQLLINGQ